MQEIRTPAQEAAEDLFFGQVVIVWARWFVIAAATFLILWTTSDPVQLALFMFPVVGLIAMNFSVHGRYLMQQPANQALIVITSLIDLLIITLIVLLWSGDRGVNSQFFIFYYPVVLAFALVFPRRIEIGYTALAIVVYAGACFLADPSFVADAIELKRFMLRLITIGAMGGLANYYFRIQRARRRAIVASPVAMQDPQPGA